MGSGVQHADTNENGSIVHVGLGGVSIMISISIVSVSDAVVGGVCNPVDPTVLTLAIVRNKGFVMVAASARRFRLPTPMRS